MRRLDRSTNRAQTRYVPPPTQARQQRAYLTSPQRIKITRHSYNTNPAAAYGTSPQVTRSPVRKNVQQNNFIDSAEQFGKRKMTCIPKPNIINIIPISKPKPVRYGMHNNKHRRGIRESARALMKSQFSLMEIAKFLEVKDLLKLQSTSHRFYD